MVKIFKFVDNNLLTILASFLLLFIPLYPKLPLFDLLPGYIVRVRLEDLFIAVTVLIYALNVIRRKAVFWTTPLTKPIILYLIVAALSLISAITLVGSIPAESLHINKALLHYLRRVEYFSLFFVFFSSVKSVRQVKFFLTVYLITMIGVIIYGYGQKYLYWPAFSTMNREFAKGWRLYLTEHARVISTFGGHYDLAAFTMMALTILWSLFFGTSKSVYRIIFFLILAGSFWLIILTASRVSFISYLIALTVVIFLWMFRRGFTWALSRWLITVSLSILVMLSFGDLSDRFQHLVKFEERFGGIRKLLLSPIGVSPKLLGFPSKQFQPISPNGLASVTSKSDQPPIPFKQTKKPADVGEELPDYISLITETGETVTVPVKRTYSSAALRFDLSTGIRLDALWPRAWQGFLRNPILGSGFSTLTKVRVSDFTEAESTDNDYLRALGETGALGAIAFFAIIITVILRLWWALPAIRDPLFFSFIAGGIAALIGLLINAVYIDVFEASKIALPFWALAGVMLGGVESVKRQIELHRRPMRLKISVVKLEQRFIHFLRSDQFFLLLLVLLAFFLRLYRFGSPLADWHSWRQADTSAVSRNFVRQGINWLYPTYDDLSSVASGRPNPTGLRMVEFPIYNAMSATVDKLLWEINIEQSGRLTSILASLGSLIFLVRLVGKYTNRRTGFLTGFFFAILPFNIYYSRVVLPEPLMVFTSLGMLYFFDRWLEIKFQISSLRLHSGQDFKFQIKHVLLYILAVAFAAFSLLIKPYAVFLFLPLVYLIVRYRTWKGLFSPSIILFFSLSVAQLIWWRWWVSHFPEGVPAYTWLFNGDGIRFKGAFFFWIFADRISRLILGYWGLPILFLGIIARPIKKAGWFFHIWLLSIVIYLFTFATGNVRHDYYQIITIPIITIFLALGSQAVLTVSRDIFNKLLSNLLLIISVLFMIAFSWYHLRDFFNINHPEIVEAGIEVDKIAKPKGLVVAPYDGDTAFLYQTNRAGWPIVEGTIDDLVAKGAHYYVSVRDDETTLWLLKEIQKPTIEGRNFKLLKRTLKYTIIQLVADGDIPQ